MLDWSKWYVLWADERAVAKTHAESNYKMTKEGLLSKVHGLFISNISIWIVQKNQVSNCNKRVVI
jgi:6-phosphogluconolactonase/glucosamine-6-phosphate isomerase/deaminase